MPNLLIGLLAVGLIGILLILLIIGLVVFFLVFRILMIIDAATRKFKNDTDKVVWILIIVFLQILGALIYYFVIKRRNKH